MSDSTAHWQRVYLCGEPEELSWHELVLETSLSLIEDACLPPDAAILDVGSGSSTLAGHLIAAGFQDVTVADIAPEALRLARAELGASGERVTWIEADIRSHDFGREFDLWHDRAVFHFMVATADRAAYLTVLRRALRAGGDLIVATFGPDGPSRCSGLPVARYATAELSGILGSDFQFVSSQPEQQRTPNGREQQFVYARFRKLSPAV